MSSPAADGTRSCLHIMKLWMHLIVALQPILPTFVSGLKLIMRDLKKSSATTTFSIVSKLMIGENQEWKFECVKQHQGPILPSNANYKGLSFNILIKWENGERSWEPLDPIAKTNPVSCSIYGKQNNLLSLPGWKCFA